MADRYAVSFPQLTAEQRAAGEAAWDRHLLASGIKPPRPVPAALRAKQADFLAGYAAAIADRSAS